MSDPKPGYEWCKNCGDDGSGCYLDYGIGRIPVLRECEVCNSTGETKKGSPMKTTPKELDLSQFEEITGGNWRALLVRDNGSVVIRNDIGGGQGIATCFTKPSFGDDTTQVEANGALIAAAPTLLAEVKRLRAENERLTKQYRDYFHMDKTGSGSAQTAILRKALNTEEPE